MGIRGTGNLFIFPAETTVPAMLKATDALRLAGLGSEEIKAVLREMTLKGVIFKETE